MIKVVSAHQMQSIDHSAIHHFGIPGIVLMENAGRAVTQLILEAFPDILHKQVIIFSGKGNNGGDGFVVARHLFNMGIKVRVCLLGRISALKSDAKINADSAVNIGVPVDEVDKTSDYRHNLRHTNLVVDAIFGTGLSKPADGMQAEVISDINASGKPVVAIDIPSGLHSDNGIIGAHVKADMTVALGLPKLSHLMFPAAEFIGKLHIVDIGIPAKAIEQQSINVNWVQESDILELFNKRRSNTHKGNYGHVLVIAGSKGKCGAAGLTGLAALRIGAGLVTLAVPESCHQALEFNPLETMTLSLPETTNGAISTSAISVLHDYMEGKNAIAIGPGLSTDPETVRFLQEFLPLVQCPIVIDADGLNCLAGSEVLSRLKAPTILTPHPKEMSRISDVSIDEILSNRIESASSFAIKNNVSLVLKGAASIMAFPDRSVYVNPTGNPGMATAGSGDVLTGIIAGLLAQGYDSKNATIAGVYIHGLAGDIYASANSETSLIAGDLLRTLPECLKRILP